MLLMAALSLYAGLQPFKPKRIPVTSLIGYPCRKEPKATLMGAGNVGKALGHPLTAAHAMGNQP